MAAEATTPRQTVPAPRKRRWRRRIAWTLGILLLLALLAPLAVGLSPVRSALADKVGQALGRKVEIGSASAFWFKGIDLEDVTIHSPEGFDGPLAKVAKIHADVDVLGLLGGKVGARVRIVQPHVTLRRNAAGDSNVKDLATEKQTETAPAEAERKEADTTSDMQLSLVLVAGTVEALEGKTAANALRDIQLSADVAPSGALAFEFQALAEGAGQGGQDARLDLRASRDANRSGRFKIAVPALQLSRLARLIEDTVSVSGLQGTVKLDGEGTLQPDDTIEGTLATHLESIAAKTPDGTQLSVRRIMGTAKLRSISGATEADVEVGMGDVRVRRQVDGRIESFREPDISLQVTGRLDSQDGLLRIAQGSLQGGQLMQVLVREPLRFEQGAATRFAGRLEAKVSLGRLGSLRGLFPALEPLAAGTLSVLLTGSGADAQDIGVGVRITDLALRPSEVAPDGYSEPTIVAAFRFAQTDDGGMRVRLTQLGARIVRLVAKDAQRGVLLTVAPGGAYAVDGDFTLGFGLQSVSRLLGPKLGLEPGERLGGTLQFVGSGRGTPEAMRLDVDVHGTGIVFPRSWGSAGPAAALSAKLVSTRKDGEALIRISDLSGLGMKGSASARLRDPKRPDASATNESEAEFTIDLAHARPWLGGFLGLDPAGQLAGRARVNARVLAQGGGQHVVATAQLNDFVLRARPKLTPIREKRVTLQADVQLADVGGRHQAKELKLVASGIQLDLSGSTYVAEPDADLDLRAVLGGDAAQLAPTLAAFLGEGYEDLRGSGKLTGTIKASGSPSDGGAALYTTTDVTLGSWATSGLNVENVRLAATRTDAAAPLAAQLRAGLNGGSALVTGTARLGGKAQPWNATVVLKGVDTSGVLVSQGVGRYLTFVLPALLPANASAAVLSGRLDANLKGGAPSFGGEALKAGLRGDGRIAMEQGEIKQSTLFGGGGSSQLGKLIAMLKVAAPESGVVLAELQKAITFQSLTSEFSVANRVVTVKQTKLDGRRVAIDMQGRVLMAGPIDLHSQVKLQGNAGRRLAGAIGGDTLPLRVRGTLEEPLVQPDVDLTKLIPVPGGGKDGLLDKIRKKLPKPPKLPKLPNPFK